eukprot:Skav203625  [mRNA]  locus=scaffold935:905529:908298:- [translate_table: standard]
MRNETLSAPLQAAVVQGNLQWENHSSRALQAALSEISEEDADHGVYRRFGGIRVKPMTTGARPTPNPLRPVELIEEDSAVVTRDDAEPHRRRFHHLAGTVCRGQQRNCE